MRIDNPIVLGHRGITDGAARWVVHLKHAPVQAKSSAIEHNPTGVGPAVVRLSASLHSQPRSAKEAVTPGAASLSRFPTAEIRALAHSGAALNRRARLVQAVRCHPVTRSNHSSTRSCGCTRTTCPSTVPTGSGTSSTGAAPGSPPARSSVSWAILGCRAPDGAARGSAPPSATRRSSDSLTSSTALAQERHRTVTQRATSDC